MKTIIISIILPLLFLSSLAQVSHFITSTPKTLNLDETTTTTTTSTDTTWLYGTSILSTCFLIAVIIYVCYQCTTLCKGSSRHTGKAGLFPQPGAFPPPPHYGNEQENPNVYGQAYGQQPAYGQQSPYEQDFRERPGY